MRVVQNTGAEYTYIDLTQSLEKAMGVSSFTSVVFGLVHIDNLRQQYKLGCREGVEVGGVRH